MFYAQCVDEARFLVFAHWSDGSRGAAAKHGNRHERSIGCRRRSLPPQAPMRQTRRWLLIALASLCGCERAGEKADFANGAATLKVPHGFRVVRSDNPNGITIASAVTPYIEVRFVYQSFREQAKINPGVSRTFLNGYAGTFGAERLSIGGPSTGALIQAPVSVGTPQEPGYESFGAVAFPDALVTFRLVAPGARGAEAILEFKASGLSPLLSGLSAVGA